MCYLRTISKVIIKSLKLCFLDFYEPFANYSKLALMFYLNVIERPIVLSGVIFQIFTFYIYPVLYFVVVVLLLYIYNINIYQMSLKNNQKGPVLKFRGMVYIFVLGFIRSPTGFSSKHTKTERQEVRAGLVYQVVFLER